MSAKLGRKYHQKGKSETHEISYLQGWEWREMNGKMGVKEMRRDTPPDTPPGPVTLRTVLWFTYSEREKKNISHVNGEKAKWRVNKNTRT